MRITKKKCRFLKIFVRNKVELEGRAVVASTKPLATDPQLLLSSALEKVNFINVFYVNLKFSSSAGNGQSSFHPMVLELGGLCTHKDLLVWTVLAYICPSHNSKVVVILVFHLCCPNLVSSQNQLKEFHSCFCHVETSAYCEHGGSTSYVRVSPSSKRNYTEPMTVLLLFHLTVGRENLQRTKY